MQKWLKSLLKPFRLQAQYNEATKSLLELIGKNQALRHRLEQAEDEIQALQYRLDLAVGVCEALEEYERVRNQTGSIRWVELQRLADDVCAMLSVWQKGTKHND